MRTLAIILSISVLGAVVTHVTGHSVAYLVFFASGLFAAVMLAFEFEAREREIAEAMRRHPAGSELR